MSAKAFKLGIAGTHSTGKSTLLRALQERLVKEGFKVGCVGDLATEARDLGFPILRDHTFESTAWIMSRGMALELEAAKGNEVVLVDRPLPDALGYLLAALRSRGAALQHNEDAYLRGLAKLHVPTYDALLMTEADPSMPIDTTKERDSDPVFRTMAECGIKEAFDLVGCSPRIVRFADRETTIETMMNVIREATQPS